MGIGEFANLNLKFKTIAKANLQDPINFYLGTKIRITLPQQFSKTFKVMKPTDYTTKKSSAASASTPKNIHYS